MISDVKPYARARMQALGYTEWTDGFNFQNIPRTLLDKAFHVALGPISGVSNNQDHQIVNVGFTVRLFASQTRTPKDLIDASVIRADAAILEMIKPTNRLVQASIKNVTFNSLDIEELDDSNDNGIIVRMELIASVFISTR